MRQAAAAAIRAQIRAEGQRQAAPMWPQPAPCARAAANSTAVHAVRARVRCMHLCRPCRPATCDEGLGAVDGVEHPQPLAGASTVAVAGREPALLAKHAVPGRGGRDQAPHRLLRLPVCNRHGARVALGVDVEGRAEVAAADGAGRIRQVVRELHKRGRAAAGRLLLGVGRLLLLRRPARVSRAAAAAQTLLLRLAARAAVRSGRQAHQAQLRAHMEAGGCGMRRTWRRKP